MEAYALDDLIGDVPVSEQIAIAISNHAHDNYVTHQEIADLKKKIEMLYGLIGDTSVAEQISIAISNIK